MSFIALTPGLYINVLQYGADPTGLTDSTTAIQNALNAAGTTAGSAVFFPSGIYIVSATLTYPGNISIQGTGDADGGTVIRVKTGTALTTPVLASADWNNNATTCGNPVEIKDIKIDGNSATSGAGAHGLVLMNFWSLVERCTVSGVTGDGVLMTAHSANGTHITNTCVEVKLSRLQVRNAGQCGIHVHDSGSPQNSCTDGFVQDCIIQGAGAGQGIYIEIGAGWYVSGNHVYGTGLDGILVSKCYATRVLNNYIDGYGSGSATYIAGISMSCLDGRGSSCIGNHIGFEPGTATGPYQAIKVTGAGSATAICSIIGNTVNGGNQSGSIGVVIQTNSSQQPYPWIVYYSNNDIQKCSSNFYSDGYAKGGDQQFLGHLKSLGNAATGTAGAGAGSGAPAPILTRATDASGIVTFGTGTSPTVGSCVNVYYNASYSNPPTVTVTANNAATAALGLYVVSNTDHFTLYDTTAPAASQANTTYAFNYHVFA